MVYYYLTIHGRVMFSIYVLGSDPMRRVHWLHVVLLPLAYQCCCYCCSRWADFRCSWYASHPTFVMLLAILRNGMDGVLGRFEEALIIFMFSLRWSEMR